MSADDAFNVLLRFAATVVWTVRLFQAFGESHQSGWTRKVVSTFCLVAVLTAITVGAIVISLDLVPDPAIRVFYTAIGTVVLIAGLAAWR